MPDDIKRESVCQAAVKLAHQEVRQPQMAISGVKRSRANGTRRLKLVHQEVRQPRIWAHSNKSMLDVRLRGEK
jgi:hypothetical protein